MLKPRKLFTVAEAKSAPRGRRTPIEPKKKEEKAVRMLRSLRDVRTQSKIANAQARQGRRMPDNVTIRLTNIEHTLKEWKQSRSLSRESTKCVNLSQSILKSSPSRTRSAGRGLYTTSVDLVKLAKVAKSLLREEAEEEDTEEGRTNTRLLRALHISRGTKADKEREEDEPSVRIKCIPVFTVSAMLKTHSTGQLPLSARVESLKCSPKTLDESDLFPEPTLAYSPRN